MIDRRLSAQLTDLLDEYPAVAVIGPRQVGKTTLAKATLAGRDGLYLDLELPSDRLKQLLDQIAPYR